MPQFGRATAVLLNEGWTDHNNSSAGADIIAAINETSPNDATYVKGPANVDKADLTFTVTDLNDPFSSGGHILKYRTAAIGTTPDYDLEVSVLQGSVEIADWETLDVSTSITQPEQTLTAGEADAITSYEDIPIRLRQLKSPLLRDDFTTDIDPMTDPRTMQPGTPAGTWDVTGTLSEIDDSWLGMFGNNTWGQQRLLADQTFARTEGRIACFLYAPEDSQDDAFIGWASGVVADPRTDGASFGHEDFIPTIATHGLKIPLSPDPANSRDFKPTLYFVGIALRAQGFYVLISAVAPITGAIQAINDKIGIPAWPSYRILYANALDTVTPLRPFYSVLSTHNYSHGLISKGMRVADVAAWSADGYLSSGIDRFNRADNTSSLGAGWTADHGTWGVISNQAYWSADGGVFNRARKDFGGNGDGIWRVKIKAPTTVTHGFGYIIRAVDANNFIRVWNNGGSAGIVVQAWVAGSPESIGSSGGSFTWVAGTDYTIETVTFGNWYKVYVNGVERIGWVQDANSRHLTATGMGPYALGAAEARWDDMECVPNTGTWPDYIQALGPVPIIPVVGATVAADTFTAANGTAIAGRTTTTGSKTWAETDLIATTGPGVFDIQSNAARNNDTSDGFTQDHQYAAYFDSGIADHEVTVNITTPAASDQIRAGVIVRFLDKDNFIVARLLRDDVAQLNSHEIELREVVAGVVVGGDPGVVRKTNFKNFFQASTSYELKAQALGRMLHIYLNGIPVISYLIDTLVTATNVGLYHDDDDDGSVFNDITVKALS
jgi:hypothetical protein